MMSMKRGFRKPGGFFRSQSFGFSSSSNPYRVLGVSKSLPIKDIKRKYLQLAQKYHPDLNPEDPDATKKFISVKHAYESIKLLKEKEEKYKNRKARRNFRSRRGARGDKTAGASDDAEEDDESDGELSDQDEESEDEFDDEGQRKVRIPNFALGRTQTMQPVDRYRLGDRHTQARHRGDTLYFTLMTGILGLGTALAVYEFSTDREERYAIQDYILYMKSIARGGRKKRPEREEGQETVIEEETKKERGYEYFNRQLEEQNVQTKYWRQRLVPETFEIWDPVKEARERKEKEDAEKLKQQTDENASSDKEKGGK